MNFILSKYFIRCLTIFLLTIFILQPYNKFCNYSNKCQAIYLSELVPTFEGNKKILITPEIKNYNKNLNFELLTTSFETVTGRTNTIKYKVKNNKKTFVKFLPKLYTNPESCNDYIIRKQCLCHEEITLKGEEQRELIFTFKVKKSFDSEENCSEEKREFAIGYTITN